MNGVFDEHLDQGSSKVNLFSCVIDLDPHTVFLFHNSRQKQQLCFALLNCYFNFLFSSHACFSFIFISIKKTMNILAKKKMNSIYTIICKSCSKFDREIKAPCRVVGKLVLQLSKPYVL